MPWWLIFEFEPGFSILYRILTNETAIRKGMRGNLARLRFCSRDDQGFVYVVPTIG
jgi:hypothetical protein